MTTDKPFDGVVIAMPSLADEFHVASMFLPAFAESELRDAADELGIELLIGCDAPARDECSNQNYARFGMDSFDLAVAAYEALWRAAGPTAIPWNEWVEAYGPSIRAVSHDRAAVQRLLIRTGVHPSEADFVIDMVESPPGWEHNWETG